MSDAATPVFLVLSPYGKIFDTFLDEAAAERRAQMIGGLVAPLTASRDFRPDQHRVTEERPAPSLVQPFSDPAGQPHRPVPDVR